MSQLATTPQTNGKPVHPTAVDNLSLKRLLPRPKPLEEIAVDQENDFAFWQNELARAERKLDRKERQDEWDSFMPYQTFLLSGNERFNFIGPPIDDLVGETTGERPEITVKMKRESQERLRPQIEALLSWDVHTKHGWNVVQRIVRDAYWFGIGWGKQIWQAGTSSLGAPDEPELTAQMESEQLAVIDMEHQMMAQSFFGQPITTMPTDVDWLHIERHEQFSANPLTPLEVRIALEAHIDEHRAQHFSESADTRSILIQVDPRNMLYDPDVDHFDKIRWVAERSVEIVDDMKQNRLYRRAAVNGIHPVEDTIDKPADDDPDTKAGSLAADHPNEGPRWEVADVWRIYDRRNERLIIYSPQQADRKLLAVKDWPYRGNIYRPLVFLPVARQIEGVPFARILMAAQGDLAFLHVQQREMIRKAPKQQRVWRKGALSTAEEAAIRKGNVDDYFVQRLPKDDLMLLDPPKVNPAIFEYRDTLFDYNNRSIRSSEVSQGVSGGAKFATEIEALLAAQGRSMRSLREQAKDWVESLKTIQKNQYHDFGTAELVMEVSGAEGIQFNPLRPDEIPLDCEVVVDLDSFSAINKEVNNRLLRELFQVLTASPQLMGMFTPEGWIKFFARLLRSHGLKDAESLLSPALAAQMLQGFQQQAPAGQAGSPGLPAPPLGAGAQPTSPTLGAMGGTVSQGMI